MTEEIQTKLERHRSAKYRLVYITIGAIFGITLIIFSVLRFLKYMSLKAYIITESCIFGVLLIVGLVFLFIQRVTTPSMPSQYPYGEQPINVREVKRFCHYYLATDPDLAILTDIRNADAKLYKLGKENKKTPIFVYDAKNYRDLTERVVMVANCLDYQNQHTVIFNPTILELENLKDSMAETTAIIPKIIRRTYPETGVTDIIQESPYALPKFEEESEFGEKQSEETSQVTPSQDSPQQ